METISLAGFKGMHFPAKDPKPNPMLFIHGAFSDHTGFMQLASQLALRGYNGYAFSRRGRLGQLPEQAAGLTFNDYLQDTLAVISSLKPVPILIGHSLGGLLVMKAAEESAEIPAMVLINTAPPAMLTAQLIAFPYFSPLLPRIFMGKPFKPSMQAFKTLALQMLPKEEQERIAQSLVPESGIVYRQMMLGQIQLKQNSNPIPTLVIGSSNDRIISRRLNKITVQRTKADYKEYPMHGHWIIEEPGVEHMIDDIATWLTKTLAIHKNVYDLSLNK